MQILLVPVFLIGLGVGDGPVPGDITQVHIQARDGIDELLGFAGGPRVLSSSVTTYVDHDNDPDTPDQVKNITASLEVTPGDFTRRQIAHRLAEQFSEQAGANVEVRGSTIYIRKTPPGEGVNTGTPDAPLRDPDDNENRPWTITFTSNTGS